MNTPIRHTLVSAAAALLLTLGACVSAGPTRPPVETAALDGKPAIHFDNQSQDYVTVYLVGVREQYLLGRVAAGARTKLAIPAELVEDASRSFWIAALSGTRGTGNVMADPRTIRTLPEHVSTMLEQRWTYTGTAARGDLTALQLWR